MDIVNLNHYTYAAAKSKALHSDAIKDFSKCTELDPSNVPAYVWRGAVYFDLGEIENAKSDIEKALRIAPDDKEVIAIANGIKEELKA